MASYKIKEMYYTLQGEGAHTGRAAVFCRFTGCNLWSGREQDRHKAICRFCDTDFVGTNGPNGGTFANAETLATAAKKLWPTGDIADKAFVVFTGGEPLLQLDKAIIKAFHKHNFEIAIETNGTINAPQGIDWICVSPKAGTELAQTSGQELKLVFPQPEAMPEQFEHFDFDHFFLQPMDGPNVGTNTKACVEYCLKHPKWNLSLQTHKYLDIP